MKNTVGKLQKEIIQQLDWVTKFFTFGGLDTFIFMYIFRNILSGKFRYQYFFAKLKFKLP